MKLHWTPVALGDLESLRDFIALDKPDAAADMVDLILEAIESLRRFPEMGRRGRVSGTRELVVRPFIVAYRAHNDLVELLGIIHSGRRWPKSF
jgi:addiction module RelE/StbE family toxin